MCGNLLVDLDATFGKFQFKYLDVYARGEYESAANILYQANASLPTDACVKEMPAFKPAGYHLRAELATSAKAKDYCNRWAPTVWRSIADYRTKMLSQIMDDD